MSSNGLIAGQAGYVYPSVDEVTSAPPHTVNLWGYHQWDDRRTADGEANFFSSNVLPAWSGYLIVLGFSGVFAVLAYFLMWAEIKFAHADNNAEQFSTAGRSLKSGLIAVDVVSHWTWPNNILGAAYWCYTYGLSGALWWCGGQSTCIWIFALMSTELKIRAPNAHTILEIIRTRWGTSSHLIFYFFAFVTNLLITAQQYQAMVLIVNYLTGASLYAIGFLVAFGVVLYAAVGGLKATFTTSYIHTVVFLAIMTWMMFIIFVVGGNGYLGNIDQMYDRISRIAEYYPISGNRKGSYLTAYSSGGYQNFITMFLGNFAYIFVDQSYWQSAIAAKPQAAIKGYMIGSFLFFPIAYCLAFTGLGLLALDLPVSEAEISNGGVVAALTWVLVGKRGPLLILVACFMAITSAGAGEMLATSSLFTFDIYRTYFRPKATSKELVMCARCGVVVWAIISGLTVVVVFKSNVSLLLLGLFPGVVLPSAVPGVLASLTWDRCTGLAANVSTVVGCALGTLAWVFFPAMQGRTGIYSSGINIDTLTLPLPLMTGGCVALGSSVILIVAISLLIPSKEHFNWDRFRTDIVMADENYQSQTAISQKSVDYMRRMRPWVWLGAGGVGLMLMILWPVLSLIQPIMSLANFRFWIVFGLIMCTSALVVAAVVPIWEAWDTIWKITRHVLGMRVANDPDLPEYTKDDTARGDKYNVTPKDTFKDGAAKDSNSEEETSVSSA